MASLFAEIQPGAFAMVAQEWRPRGVQPIKEYRNLSRFMGFGDIWLFDAPVGTEITPLVVPGVMYLEPDEEHNYAQKRWREQQPFGTGHLTLGALLGREAVSRNSLPEIMNLIDVPRTHRQGITGAGVVVLVVDSGVNGDAIPDRNKAGGWTDDPDGDPWRDGFGHGTMVARLVLAVAPGALIYSVKVQEGPNGGLMKESVMQAVNDLVPVVKANPTMQLVMNNSWGTAGCEAEPYWCGMLPARLMRGLVSNDVASATLAAGNANIDCSRALGKRDPPTIICINSTPGSVVVAALDASGRPQFYSSRGPGQCSFYAPWISAPTFGVLPWGSGWRDFGEAGAGTSSTTPMVSGCLALMRQMFPGTTNVDLLAALAASAKRLLPSENRRGPLWDRATGFGMLQVGAALETLSNVHNFPEQQRLAAEAMFIQVKPQLSPVVKPS